jgi:DNA primase
MGTALTERQLKELQRLTKRLFLCFDSDAAGREATLRGMELAVGQGFDVKVVPLPKGSDPADDPATFQDRLATPVSYLVHRVRLLYEGATDKQAAFATIKLFLNAHPDSPEHLDARQLAADLLGLPPETQATFAPSTSRSRSAGVISPRLLEAGHRLERSALAGVALHPSLNKYLEKLSPEHFDLELHRRARAHLLGGEVADDELTPLIDELYALAGMEDINEQAAEQMLLRLQERHLKRELDEARPDHMGELQQRLAQVRTAIREFA